MRERPWHRDPLQGVFQVCPADGYTITLNPERTYLDEASDEEIELLLPNGTYIGQLKIIKIRADKIATSASFLIIGHFAQANTITVDRDNFNAVCQWDGKSWQIWTKPDALPESECPTINLSTLPNMSKGAAVNLNITATAGTEPITYAVTSGALPTGLSLASAIIGGLSYGVLTGTPTENGTFVFTVTATDASDCQGSRAYSVVVSCAAITVSPSTLPAGSAGVAYSQALGATGGVGAYTYAVTSGSLPTGLALSSGGALTGTPAAAGTYNFTVTATDSIDCTGAREYSVVISCPTITVSPTTLDDGIEAEAYSDAVSAAGGTGPYTYAVTAGLIPPGLTLATNGNLTGTPTAGGAYTFTVTATNANGCTGNREYTIIITPIDIVPCSNPIPTMTSNTAPSGVASASSIAGSANDAWKAMDGLNSTYWKASAVAPQWLRYQSTTAHTYFSYSLTARLAASGALQAWTLEGSNDGSAWTVIDTRTGVTWTDGQQKNFTIVTPGSYIYHRVNISSAIGAPEIVKLALCTNSLCLATTEVVLDETINYTTVCGASPGAFHFESSSLVNEIDLIALHDFFVFAVFHDGLCPLRFGSPHVERAHPAGSITVGPYPYDTVLFAATMLYVDDFLKINGTIVSRLGDYTPKGRVLHELPAGATATITCTEVAGAFVFAGGYIGVCLAECAPPGCQFITSTIPVMTDYQVPSGRVHATGTSGFPDGVEPWNLTDNNPATIWYFQIIDIPAEEWLSGVPGSWWRYDFDQPRRLFGEYAVTLVGSNGPQMLRLQAANAAGVNDDEWIDLDVRQDLVWEENETKVFSYENIGAYKSYRVDMNVNTYAGPPYEGGTAPALSHIRMAGCAQPDPPPDGWCEVGANLGSNPECSCCDPFATFVDPDTETEEACADTCALFSALDVGDPLIVPGTAAASCFGLSAEGNFSCNNRNYNGVREIPGDPDSPWTLTRLP